MVRHPRCGRCCDSGDGVVDDADDARWWIDDGRWKLSSVRSCWQKGEERSMRMSQEGIVERIVMCPVVDCFVLRSSQRLFLNRWLACYQCLIARLMIDFAACGDDGAVVVGDRHTGIYSEKVG